MSWNNFAAAPIAADHLITTPRTLDHLHGLCISKAAVALRTSHWRRDEGLVRLPLGTVEQVVTESAWLAQGDPRMTAGRRIVLSAEAHVVQV